MLDAKSLKDLAACKAAGAEVWEATSRTTGKFDYPVFLLDTVNQIGKTTQLILVNRMLRTDYRNAANRPESQVKVLKQKSISIYEDAKLSDHDKVEAYAKLHGYK